MTAPTDHIDCARLGALLTKDMQTAHQWTTMREPGEASLFTARAHLTLHTLAGAMGYTLERKETR